MLSRLSSVICAASLLAVSATGLAAGLPSPKVDYSADRIIESEAGTFTGKVYAASGNERTEMHLGDMQSVMILRRDKQLGWTLMPMQKMYSQIDFAQAQQQSGAAPADEVEITEVGAESVEGHDATKYKLLLKNGSAGGFIWITSDGIPVKMDMLSKDGRKKSRMTVTLKNLQTGAQDPQLFELPEGYSPMTTMGAFGGAFGGENKGPGVGGVLKGALSRFGR